MIRTLHIRPRARSACNRRSKLPLRSLHLTAGGGRVRKSGLPTELESLLADSAPQSPQFSLAKDKIRILLLEGVNDSAVELMQAAGYSSIERLPKALDGRGAAAKPSRACTCSASARARRSTRGRARGRRPADRDRLLQRRHQPGRRRRRAPASAFRSSMRRSPTPAASPNW